MITTKDYFDFMMRRVKHVADTSGDKPPQAFGRWFSDMYFQGITKILIPDGSGDGKVDVLVTCHHDDGVQYQILNTKFTTEYNKSSPVSFYDEITRYWQAFENKANRPEYLKNAVRDNLREHYKKLFKLYDEGNATLYFVTNHKSNEKQHNSVRNYGIEILHLENVLQYVAEHTEGAMPETESLLLSGISNVLTPATNESEVPTSIIFARLIDFIRYMERDPLDLLFARNVRLWLGDTETNKGIQETFEKNPKEFAYSNNGITILCKTHTHNPGNQELFIENPRVVNGSQTLHSIRSVDDPSTSGRVMVRVIEVPFNTKSDLPAQIEKRKEIIHKISIRSNQQNPIKRWNLVSNDDFQNELARHFWSKHLYYERRQKEWKHRKLELQALNIQYGIDLRWMVQLIAAYHYDSKGLGAGIAQGQIDMLFEDDPYKIVRATPPERAYQIFLLGEIVLQSLRRLRAKRQYIANLKSYIELALFSLICKSIRSHGVTLGKKIYSQPLEEYRKGDTSGWDNAVKSLVDIIFDQFNRQAKRELKAKGKVLSIANFVKNRKLVNELMLTSIPKAVSKEFADLVGGQ